MPDFVLNPAKLGFVLATRAAGAFGLGMLVASELSKSRRRKLGRGLAAFGALTTIPGILTIVRSRRTAT